MPVSYLPPNVFLNAKHVVGRLPSARIIATDMVRSERLADKINGAGLNATMPHGLRAMAIPIQGVEAVAGFVRPGDYVDLLFSTRQRTETRFQALEVLAVNSRLEGETAAMASRRRGKHPPNIVFAVTPENATELATLLATSTPTLTLRNPLDQRPVETPGIGLDELMEPYRLQRDLDALRPPAKQQPAPTTVIHRGKDTEILRIETIEPVEPPEPTR
jgi:pilus assembly protein CpaB